MIIKNMGQNFIDFMDGWISFHGWILDELHCLQMSVFIVLKMLVLKDCTIYSMDKWSAGRTHSRSYLVMKII